MHCLLDGSFSFYQKVPRARPATRGLLAALKGRGGMYVRISSFIIQDNALLIDHYNNLHIACSPFSGGCTGAAPSGNRPGDKYD